MDEYQALHTRIEKLEAWQLETAIALNGNNILTEQCTAAISDMNKTMIAVQNTMSDISKELQLGKKQNDTLEGKVNTLAQKVDKISNKLNVIDEEGKMNIRLWIKEYFPQIVVFVSFITMGYFATK